jgi:hypothetical protein
MAELTYRRKRTLRAELFRHLANDVPLTMATGAVGLPLADLAEWRRTDPDFDLALTKAEAETRIRLLGRLRTGTKDDRAAAATELQAFHGVAKASRKSAEDEFKDVFTLFAAEADAKHRALLMKCVERARATTRKGIK